MVDKRFPEVVWTDEDISILISLASCFKVSEFKYGDEASRIKVKRVIDKAKMATITNSKTHQTYVPNSVVK